MRSWFRRFMRWNIIFTSWEPFKMSWAEHKGDWLAFFKFMDEQRRRGA